MGKTSEFAYEYEAKLERVIDGDTVVCWIDLGFNIWHRAHVRLNGIDTPEVRTKDLEEKALGQAAAARLEAILVAQEDKKFVLVSEIYTGKYGRILGTIYAKLPGSEELIDINRLLIQEGHAKPYTLPGQ